MITDEEDYSDDEEWEVPSDGSALFEIEGWQNLPSYQIKSLWRWSDPENVPLRISISGAAGTGKRKLSSDLASELEITSIDSIARTNYRLGGDINTSSSEMDEFMMFLAHLWEESEYSEFASAGSMIDLLAHCHYIAEVRDDPKWTKLVRGLANLINTQSNNSYTVLFYLPYSKKPRADGIRSTNVQYNERIDELILHYLTSFDLDFLPLVGNRKEKFSTAMEYLQAFGLAP